METTPEFNNHILTDQERRQFTIIADETLQTFAESIDGMHQTMQEFPPSQNQEFNHKMDKRCEYIHQLFIWRLHSSYQIFLKHSDIIREELLTRKIEGPTKRKF